MSIFGVRLEFTTRPSWPLILNFKKLGTEWPGPMQVTAHALLGARKVKYAPNLTTKISKLEILDFP